MNQTNDILYQLFRVIQDRQEQRPEHSYTTRLFDGGVKKIGVKVTEEASELVEAAELLERAIACDNMAACNSTAADEPGDADRANVDKLRHEVVHESVDLIYHMLVIMAHSRVELTDVQAELSQRFGISGLDEKAARGKDGS